MDCLPGQPLSARHAVRPQVPRRPLYLSRSAFGLIPISRKVRLGETVIFEDRAADRQAASRKLGATGTDTDEDYTLRVT